MSSLLILIPFIVVIMMNYVISTLLSISYGRSMVITFFQCMLFLYVSQYELHTYKIGLAGIIVMSAAAIPIYKNRKEELHKDVFPGLYIFVGICLFVIVWDIGRSFTIFDEFYFWGPMVKESLRLDRFYSDPESTILLHKDYPPFITLFEYMWCKLSLKGYSEGTISMAVHTLLLSISVLPIGEQIFRVSPLNEKKRNDGIYRILQGAAMSACFMLIVFILDPWTPRGGASILVDVLVAVIFAYAMFIVYKRNVLREKKGILELTAINTLMIMIKQVSLGFLMVVALYSVMSIMRYKSKDELPIKTSNAILRYMMCFIIPLGVYYSWSIYVKKMGISGQFDLNNISFKEIVQILFVNKSGIRYDTLNRFIHAIGNRNISTSWLPITYGLTLIIAVILIWILQRKNKKNLSVGEGIAITISFVCNTAGYAFVMAVLYMFCFNEYEMENLSSYERYMASFVLGEFLLLSCISIDICLKKDNTLFYLKKHGLALMVAVALLSPSNFRYILPQGMAPNQYAWMKNDADYIADITEDGVNVLTVYDSSKITSQYWVYLLYYADRKFYPAYSDIYNLLSQKDIPNTDKEVEEQIKKCDYLYIKHSNQFIENRLSNYLLNGSIKSDGVYRIENVNNTLKLMECR